MGGGSQLDSTLKGPPESKHVCLFLQHSEGRNKVGGGCGEEGCKAREGRLLALWLVARLKRNGKGGLRTQKTALYWYGL